MTEDEACVNALRSATRAVAERGDSLLKNPFKALKHVTPCPWRTGVVVAAALVVLRHEHDRTT